MEDGAAIVARSGARADWLQAEVTPAILDALDEDTRRALGEAWLDDASVEHASIASFSRVSMELMAVGAPPELIEASHHAALDEVRHARICFALARAYLRRDVGPGPLPLPSPRVSSIADVAADAFLEGCVGESLSALVAARAAERCVDAEVKRLLSAMARDEEAHAALAFRTLAWCLRVGGRPVAERIAALLESPPRHAFHSAKIGNSTLGRLEGEALVEAARDAWGAIVTPTARALL